MAAGSGWASVAWRSGAGGGVGGRPGGARRLAGGGSRREARVDGARRVAELGGLSAACGRAEHRRDPVWRRSRGRFGGEARAAGWQAERGGRVAERGGRSERDLRAGGLTAARRLSVISAVAAPHRPRCAILVVPPPCPPSVAFHCCSPSLFSCHVACVLLNRSDSAVKRSSGCPGTWTPCCCCLRPLLSICRRRLMI